MKDYILTCLKVLYPKTSKAAFMSLFTEKKEITFYIICGVLTTAISFGSYFLFREMFRNFKFFISYTFIPMTFSWICAVLFAYFSNRIFVFESKTVGIKKLREFISFAGSRVTTYILDIGFVFLTVEILYVNEVFSRIVSSIAVLILNYIISKKLVFKKK